MNKIITFILMAISSYAFSQECVTLSILNNDIIEKIEVSRIDGEYLIYDGIRKIGHKNYNNGNEFAEIGTVCKVKCGKDGNGIFSVQIELKDRKFVKWDKEGDGVVPIISTISLSTIVHVKNGETKEISSNQGLGNKSLYKVMLVSR